MEKIDTCKKTVLPNGVTIVTQKETSFYSAVVGIWVKNGSRDENSHNNGISHFIEHMLFKGTPRRSPHDISKTIDAVGGELNAFTSRESSCYYARVLKEHLPIAVDLLSDIFLNSLFDAEELEKEREVILQEIRMVEDTPDDYIHDLLNKTFWPNSSIGMPVLGNVENVSSFNRAALLAFMKERYHPDNIIITAAGNIDHEQLVDFIGESFSSLSAGDSISSVNTSSAASEVTILNKDLEQIHFCIGSKGISDIDSNRYAAFILNTILGDGMGSRLFQEIREKKGLAYSVYSFLSSYIDCGMFGIYAGTGREHFSKILPIITAELNKLKSVKISPDDLSCAKQQLKGNMILGLENSDSRMQRLAHNEICFGRHISVEETIKNIENVSQEDVLSLARDFFVADSLNIALIGNIEEDAAINGFNKMKYGLNS